MSAIHLPSLRSILGWIAILAASLSPVALAQDAPPAQVPTDTAAKATKVVAARPALWKIADEDTTIYLFGTIHVLPAGIDWFNGPVADAFTASGTLVTEVAQNDPATMQRLVTKLAMLPADETLLDRLSPDQRARFESALAQYKIPPGLLDRFEPWYAAVALSTMPLMQEGFDVHNGVEEQLDTRAKARGLPHSGLETAEYQLGLFDALPEDVQEGYLAEVIDQLPSLKSQITEMVEAWKKGDAKGLARIMNAQESDPILLKTLLTDRNRAWADWLRQRLDEPGTVFLAVGAGHLAGPGSVQEQLAARGIATVRLQ